MPIRLRVAAAFAVTMAIVLAATGLLLYVRLGRDLSSALDRDLQLRADDVTVLVQEGVDLTAPDGANSLVELGESFAQLVDADGTVVDASRSVVGATLLSPAELAQALESSRTFERNRVQGLDEPARLLALPVERDGERLVLIVGATAEDRAEALRGLRTGLAVLLPLALLVATGSGYLLAGAGLRAVDAMRARAEDITADRPGERLPVAATGDELERLGHTLNEMLGRLEQAIARERGFVAEAGHELRTPLGLLRAELDLALAHSTSEEELRATLREASDETDRLVQLAEGLLLIATADEGELPLHRETLPAAELLVSVRNRFLRRATDSGRELVVLAPEGLRLEGDRLRLEQALGNLLDNALRHGAGTVELEAREGTNRSIELHVRDDGAGLPTEFLPRAFHRFSRPATSRGGSGAGLGLAIVASIARAHGGTANVVNRKGEGACGSEPQASGCDVWLALPG